jgi:hypothetical protein
MRHGPSGPPVEPLIAEAQEVGSTTDRTASNAVRTTTTSHPGRAAEPPEWGLRPTHARPT